MEDSSRRTGAAYTDAGEENRGGDCPDRDAGGKQCESTTGILRKQFESSPDVGGRREAGCGAKDPFRRCAGKLLIGVLLGCRTINDAAETAMSAADFGTELGAGTSSTQALGIDTVHRVLTHPSSQLASVGSGES